MKTGSMQAFPAVCLVLLSAVASQPARAETLEDILGVGKTELRESSPETKKLWDGLLSALETSNFVNALSPC
jgi:hypothetical protein